ncbi:ComF family protein [Cohnella caldifontis]|uniref:ComF family protein n=1 Tax=Cohnella caldifontis TaxID=3027471 RepID=UPI0023EC6F05|nr:ComF family protein [Cohnella sp. YIM B05605]
MRFSWNRWLEPSNGPCPVCGKRSAGGKTAACPVRHPEAASVLRQLCTACAETIPWIRKPVCRVCGRSIACPDCPRRAERALSFSRGAVRYDAAMKDWLAMYKYRGSEKLEAVMAAMAAFGYERILTELRTGTDAASFVAVTAVPLAAERLAERGFNQAERMARTLAGWYSLPYRPLLKRNRHTEKQSLKSRRGRLEDMRGNFSPNPAAFSMLTSSQPDETCRILLVDDVYTTGSTLQECARSIRLAVASQPANAQDRRVEVYGLAWARS